MHCQWLQVARFSRPIELHLFPLASGAQVAPVGQQIGIRMGYLHIFEKQGV